MATYKLLLLPGDGIGPEVMAEVEKVVAFLEPGGRRQLRDRDATSSAAPPMTRTRSSITEERHGAGAGRRRRAASAPSAGRNGTACPTTCAPRRACCACARISACSPICVRRSAIPALADASSLKREIVEGLDIMIVRELTGGVYFGEPKEIVDAGATARSAPSTRRSTRPTRSSASAASPSSWRASAATR